jgi:hypothetical protein
MGGKPLVTDRYWRRLGHRHWGFWYRDEQLVIWLSEFFRIYIRYRRKKYRDVSLAAWIFEPAWVEYLCDLQSSLPWHSAPTHVSRLTKLVTPLWPALRRRMGMVATAVCPDCRARLFA